MSDLARDLHRNVTAPIVDKIDGAQKKIRKGVVKMIDVPEEQKKSSRPVNDVAKKAPKSEEALYSLESLRHWDVMMPPIKKKKLKLPKPGVKNAMQKVGLGRVFNKKRRITIELYKKITPKQAEKNKEQERRVFKKLYQRASVINTNDDNLSPLEDDDFILFRILKEKKHGVLDLNDDDSHSEASHIPNGALESHMLVTYDAANYGDGIASNTASQWKERHRSRISTVEIDSVQSRMVTLKIGVGLNMIEREISFEDPHEVETFVKTFDKMRELMIQRGQRMAVEERLKRSSERITSQDKKAALKSSGLASPSGLFSSLGLSSWEEDPQSKVNLLVEIVSAINLPSADINSSDPYVCVEDGRQRLHKTEVVSKTLNPVWTLSTGSLFLIQTTLSDFFANAKDIEFVVKDYDRVGDNDILGRVLVPKKDLLQADGCRVDHVLKTKKRNGHKTSFLTLRCKQATKDDIDFLQTFESKKKTGMLSKLGKSSNVTGVYAEECSLPPRLHPSKLFRRTEKPAEGIAVKYRVKPFPDPTREAETKWMTEHQIQTEWKEPSREWVEAGSGSIGKFYLEVLGCDGLPNLDLSVTGQNKSDPFVLIAFEDCVVNTDVINDCLSPRWMPWTRRAFVFNVMHPSSQFYIAVMDYEETKAQHDKIGRVVVNPTNLRPDTMYTMRYNLLDSNDKNRKTMGQITFRLRFESASQRQFLLSAFQTRTRYSVSTNNRAESESMTFALTNEYDAYMLSLESIDKYLNELLDYQVHLEDIFGAFLTVILWRGHFPLNFCSFTVKAPFHSMIAFTWAILLSYDFDRFGSFLCFSLAWILFATLEVQRKNPNPWKRPRTYIDLLGTFVFNKPVARHIIAENENIEETMLYDERYEYQMKFRRACMEESVKRQELEQQKLLKEEKELDKQSRDKVMALSLGPSRLYLAPFEDILAPVQKMLYEWCVYSRCISSVVTWSDSVVAFWIASVALLASFLLFFVPWTFLFRWGFRIVSIALLGPWMKLVDIFFIQSDDDDSMPYEERKAKMEVEMQERYDFIVGDSRIRRIFKERRMKIRDMEKYLFGKYGVRVPIYKEERFASIPLAGGFAEPYNPANNPPPNIVKRVNGQVLTGDMIMKREDPARAFKAQKQREVEIPDFISMESTQFPRNDDEMAPLLEDDDDDQYGALDV